jgi:hypothetical protein
MIDSAHWRVYNHASAAHMSCSIFNAANQEDHLFLSNGGAEMTQAYCVKDRMMVEIKDPKPTTLKNGRPAIQGVCPTCGTKVTRIGSGK